MERTQFVSPMTRKLVWAFIHSTRCREHLLCSAIPVISSRDTTLKGKTVIGNNGAVTNNY